MVGVAQEGLMIVGLTVLLVMYSNKVISTLPSAPLYKIADI
jgi:hypothetical protein